MYKRSIPSSLMLFISFLITMLVTVFGLHACMPTDDDTSQTPHGIIWGSTMVGKDATTEGLQGSKTDILSPADVKQGTKPDIKASYDAKDANIGVAQWHPQDARMHQDQGQKFVSEQAQRENSESQTAAPVDISQLDDIQENQSSEVQTSDTSSAETDFVTYQNTINGFMFDYPKSWKKQQDEEGSAVFTVEKVALPEFSQTPEVATIKVTYLPYQKKFSSYKNWVSKFPQGSETVISEDGTSYALIDIDSEAAFVREYYKTIKENQQGIVHFQLSFQYSHPPVMEDQTSGDKEYREAAHEYAQEVKQQFVEVIDSIKQLQ